MGNQLTFLDVFEAAAEEAASAHLPSTIEASLPVYREMLDRYHAAMLEADPLAASCIQNEADKLARRLNNNDPGILADDESPGNVLRVETAAPTGDIPLWGQAGDFILAVGDMKVRIEVKGIFGIGGPASFAAHAVDCDRPFLSETGFRSFMGIHFEAVAGMTFDVFVREVLRAHIARELKGKLRPIHPRYRQEATPGVG